MPHISSLKRFSLKMVITRFKCCYGPRIMINKNIMKKKENYFQHFHAHIQTISISRLSALRAQFSWKNCTLTVFYYFQ